MFCLSMNSNHLNFIKEFDYVAVGLGEDKFSKEWLQDNTGKNISEKNKYYGEYTFHYWLWENYLDKLQDGWIGFCQYRKFWSIEKSNTLPNSLNQLKPLILKEIPKTYEDFDAILGDLSSINDLKIMKFLKKGIKLIAKQPSYLFNKEKRNIKFHFDLMHGYNNLDKAIELLDDDNKKDFHHFVNKKTSFNPHNMFICRSFLSYVSIPWRSKRTSKIYSCSYCARTSSTTCC